MLSFVKSERMPKSDENAMYSFREPVVNIELLEQGGCGTLGEYYYENRYFTGTFVAFNETEGDLWCISECENGLLHGLSIDWDDKSWERYEYGILLESGSWSEDIASGEKLFETMSDPSAYVAKYRYLYISQEEKRQRIEKQTKREECLKVRKFIIELILFVILVSIWVVIDLFFIRVSDEND